MGKKSDELVALLNDIRAKTEAYYNGLPEKVRTANGTWEVWAPKDALAHLAFWQNNLVDILNNLQSPPPEQAPFNERNHSNFLKHQSRAWSDVYNAYAASHDMIVEHIKTFSDEDLETPNRFPRIANGSLQGTILGNTVGHSATHLSELLTKNGNEKAGQDLQELVAQKTIEYDPSPRTKGVTFYNLACFYALGNHPRRTVELLKEAFPLRPDLVDFSKEDTDFDAVRERPEFQALYN